MYFVKTDERTVIPYERHRIKIPALGWVRLKEKGYIPTGRTIRSGCVSRMAGHYYVSVVVEVQEAERPRLNDYGIGIDLGIKDFAVVSDGTVYGNINRSAAICKAEKKLKREQRRLSRKYESLKQHKNDERRSYSAEYPETAIERTETSSAPGAYPHGLYSKGGQ